MARMRQQDLTGKRFGALLVKRSVRTGNGYDWECQCDCGATVVVRGNVLKTKQRRCRNCMGPYNEHGEGPRGRCTAEYRAWSSMISRCERPATRSYPYYGGRGIHVCTEWRRSYVAFLRDVGRRPSAQHSLDRIDCNGHYEPGNVRWATAQEQRRNRRDFKTYVVDGQALTVGELALRAGVKLSTMWARLKSGIEPSAALRMPFGREYKTGRSTTRRHHDV